MGDRLFYSYDFGDDWQHVLTLEAVLDWDESSPRAVCTGGRRDGPAEDCGGVPGYELITAATDLPHGDHAAADFARFFGGDADPAEFSPTPFDIGEINAALAELGLDESLPETDLPRGRTRWRPG